MRSEAVLAGLGAVMELLVVVGLLVGLAAVGIVACSAVSGDTSACDRAKPDNAECATVYQCARRVDGERIELCIRYQDLAAAELENGPCEPSRDERFAPYADLGVSPPCFWMCPATQPGCNAKSGCFCGGVTP